MGWTPLIHAQSLDKLDEDKGFLDFDLGADMDHTPPLLQNGKQQKMDLYRPVNDTLRFQGVELKTIRLRFFQNHMHSIVVRVEGEARSGHLLSYFEKRYGEPKKTDNYDNSLHWRTEKVALLYDRNLMTGDVEFQFIDVETHKIYELWMYNRVNED